MARKVLFNGLLGVPLLGVVAVLLMTRSAWSDKDLPPNKRVIPDKFPSSWDMEEIEKEALPSGSKGHVYMLAWMAMEDDRPFQVESCLVLGVLENKAGYWL